MNYLRLIYDTVYRKTGNFLYYRHPHLRNMMPDKMYLQCLWKEHMGYEIDLRHPKSFNEKIQWLKLHNRKPIYTIMVDKAASKDYVASIIGEEHIIPTLGIYNCFDEIDFDALPNQFVLKSTHDSGGVYVCKNKSKLDYDKARNITEGHFRRNVYYKFREWPYKNVKPRIIAEKYMVDESGTELKDYKFFCFNGEVKAMFIATDRNNPNVETKFDFFDSNFNHLPFTNGHPNAFKELNKPEGFEEMKQIASKLSDGIEHLRVDLYNANGKIYFGELTFFHWSGLVPFSPPEWDYKFGKMLKLPIDR